MLQLQRWAVYATLLILHISGLCIFLKGFFPSKVVLPGHNVFEGHSPFSTSSGKGQFERVIVMVVDAMRSDFMFSERRSQMSFIHKLVSNGLAIPFTAFSNPPTVTLPRLKGITTGGAPNFLDAILNIADDNDDSQGLSTQDSWVHQFKNHGRRRELHFYGDDTWLKLFPPDEYFEKYEGTNSFFVSDYTEVDNNVTRHLDNELSNDAEWEGLILHYLGLDHIGHKGGPDSPFMGPKQKEMDVIVERLYSYILGHPETLLVVMGDHGMNEIGNHGASTAGETNPGLVFISPRFSALKSNNLCPVIDNEKYQYFDQINQIDLVPTMASLLDFPVPRNNLGVFIKELLPLWDSNESKVKVLEENCKQLYLLLKAKYSSGDSGDTMEKWASIDKEAGFLGNFDLYYEFLYSAQQLLAQSATNYNYSEIWTGFSIILTSTVLSVIYFNHFILSKASVDPLLLFTFEAFAVVYSIHFHGSSLIEEEHHLWWFFSTVFLLCLLAYLKPKSHLYFLVTVIGMRTIKAWNNSGQKYASVFTISAYLTTNKELLWFLIILTYTVIGFSIYAQGSLIDCFSLPNTTTVRNGRADFGSFSAFMMTSVISSLSFVFKLAQFYNDGNDVPVCLRWVLDFASQSYGFSLENSSKKQLQDMNLSLSKSTFTGVWGLIILRLGFGFFKSAKHGTLTDMANCLTLLLAHQTRCEMIPIFLVFALIKYAFANILTLNRWFSKGNLDQLILVVSLFTLNLQNLSFFSIGNTNLLATVDLSNAYNGIETYDVLFVGILTFVSNFAVVIYWSLASLQLIFETSLVSFSTSESSDLGQLPKLKGINLLFVKILASLIFYAIGAVNLVASCINLRFHLFIWTVFSPRLLYFAAWTILVNGIFDCLLALALFSFT